MSILEIIAIIFTLSCVYLTSNKNIWCWPVGIVSIIAFFLLYIREELYIQTVIQVIFLLQSIYGWYIWSKSDKQEFKISDKDTLRILKDLIGVIFSAGIIGFMLESSAESSMPYLDALSSMLCLLATYYLFNKYIQSWLIWMSVNALLFGMFLYQGLYLLSGLEIILFIISFNAYISWKKDLKTVSA